MATWLLLLVSSYREKFLPLEQLGMQDELQEQYGIQNPEERALDQLQLLWMNFQLKQY